MIMKKSDFRLVLVTAVSIALITMQSCEMLGLASLVPDGELRVAFASEQESLTRSGLEIPDTSDFLLTVRDSKGKIVYNGTYGDSPESFSLNPGSYTVTVISEEFSKPAFSAPQFGDEQCVMIPSGKTLDLKLVCSQINSGIRLSIDPRFLDAYPEGVLLLKSSFGRLVYGYSERRIAYFKPGDVSLILNEGKTDQHMMPYGKGNVDFAEVIHALREVGYEGLFNLEIPGERLAPLEIRGYKLEYIRKCYDYMMNIE